MGTKLRNYSRVWPLKTVAFILCCVLICASVVPVVKSVAMAAENSMTLDDFHNESYLESDVCYFYKERAVYVYLCPLLALRSGDERVMTAYWGDKLDDVERTVWELKLELESMEGILYYATDGETVITNTQQEEFSYYEGFITYMIVDNPAKRWEAKPQLPGRMSSQFHRYNPTVRTHVREEAEASAEQADEQRIAEFRSKCRVYVALTDEYVEKQQDKFRETIIGMKKSLKQGSLCLGGAVLCLLYLLTVCGRRRDSEGIHGMVIDRMWSEISLMFVCLWPVFVALAAYALFEEVWHRSLQMFGLPLVVVGALSAALWLAMALSVVRNIKARMFLSRSLTVQLWKIVWQLCCRFGVGLCKMGRGLRRMVVRLTCGGTYRRRVLWGAVIAIAANLMLGILLLIGVRGAFLWVLGVIVVDGLVIWVLLQHSEQLEDIFQGVRKLREGNLEHRISIPKNGMLRELAEDINGVADGMKISVSKEIKAERMKTELITNVSHDLKTPLTSIVNYTQLLSQEELSPPEANDYVKVIRQKSEKLKNLTQDLFDISKAQSGSIDVQMEQLDLAVLVKQALGEAEEGLEKAGLSCRVKVNGSTEILGDGKLLARVAENLIGNIVKYALPNTRVYIEMEEQKDMVIAQFKNVAGYEMNFSGEEITQRFVRGDSARTTDGTGLGLAIAQSYAAACGGELEVVVDGDLFKAILKLGRAA